jgi:ubiquinone biosynthesis UbiH/UbiF/VisC/COQ6 family hydroxylase
MARYDFVIAGAGLVGLSAALALTRQGLKGLVFDRGAAPGGADAAAALTGLERSPRVSAINPVSVNFLTQLGVDPTFFDDVGGLFSGMTVWDGEGSGELSLPASGYIIENHRLLGALFKAICRPSVSDLLTQQFQVGIADIRQDDTGVVVTLTNDEQIETALLIGADGSGSRTRELLGIRCVSWRYDQSALVCVIETALPHQSIARQSFTADGPLAFLPLPEPNHSVLVWSSTRAQAQLASSETQFAAEVSAHSGRHLGPVMAIGPRRQFPLRQQHSTRYTKGASVLVGDAAHSIHPLAGQGLNLGFADVASLSQAIENLRLDQRSRLSVALSQYEAGRRPINLRMTATTDLLKRVFDPRSPLLRLTRNAGMRWLQDQPRLKQALSLAAAGRL